MSWSFAGTAFRVRWGGVTDIPSARDWTVHRPPGVDRIPAKRPGKRHDQRYRLSIFARTDAEYLTVKALFEAATDGTLKRPMGDDHWVYIEAFVENMGEWSEIRPGIHACEVEFACPHAPTLESTGDKLPGL